MIKRGKNEFFGDLKSSIKIKKEFNWQTEVNFEEGIKKTVDFLKVK